MQATVTSGDGSAASFVSRVTAELTTASGFRPYPGTLNLTNSSVRHKLPEENYTHGSLSTEHCDGVVLYPCSVDGIRAAILRPRLDGYPETKIELIAPVELRRLYELRDGQSIDVHPPTERWFPDGLQADPTALDSFDAVLFDLDGTLLSLDVNWDAVATEVEAVLADSLPDGTLDGYDERDVLRLARQVGRYDRVDAILTDYEEFGASEATKRPLLDILPTLDCPVAVCTANATTAATQALERFGVAESVTTIVGRNSTTAQKPDPEPVETALARCDVRAGNTVFVGDKQSDAIAARDAGTSFLYSDQFRFTLE